MLLTLFLIFLAISIVLTIIGFAFDVPIFTLIGTVMIFSLGIMMLETPLDYKIGENIGLEYGVNLSNSWSSEGGSVPSNIDPYVFNTNTTNDYLTYDDGATNRYGWLIASLGVFAFIGALFTI